MTPLLTALSSFFDAVCRADFAASASPGGLAELAHCRLELGLHGLVALVSSLVLTVALDLGLDVCHEGAFLVVRM